MPRAMPRERVPDDPDPTMPRRMPPLVAREIEGILGWRARPNPIDVYDAIRDALVTADRDTGT